MTDLGLKGRRALVQGASKGLGRAIAEGLSREGAHVIAAARNADTIVSWVSERGSEAGSVSCVRLNLADFASVETLIADVLRQGGVDILVNSSGGPPPADARDATRSDWLAHFEAMAANLFHITQQLLPPMIQRRFCRIITIGSSGIAQPIPRLALSNGIRSAILGWSKTLAGEVAAHGVTVNMVLPGRITLSVSSNSIRQRRVAPGSRWMWSRRCRSPQYRQAAMAWRKSSPTSRFFLRARASYVTGATIRVDGGAIRAV